MITLLIGDYSIYNHEHGRHRLSSDVPKHIYCIYEHLNKNINVVLCTFQLIHYNYNRYAKIDHSEFYTFLKGT